MHDVIVVILQLQEIAVDVSMDQSSEDSSEDESASAIVTNLHQLFKLASDC